MVRTILRVLLLAVAFLLGTALVGWWTVPLLAALWGVIAYRVPRTGVLAGLAALLAWAALLLLAARSDAFGELARALAGVVQVPAASLIALTLIFPALLAWSAARVAAVATTLVRRRDAAPEYVTASARHTVEETREVYAAQ